MTQLRKERTSRREVDASRVALADLRRPMTVTISGREPWLQDFYRSFAHSDTEAQAPLTGQITLTLLSDTFVQVQGHVAFEPKVPCARCGEVLIVAVKPSLEIILEPEPEDGFPRDFAPDSSELDRYYYQKDVVELEPLINDAVQLALPLRTLCEDFGRTPCEGPADLAGVSSDRGQEIEPKIEHKGKARDADRSGTEPRQHPFADLANLAAQTWRTDKN